MAAIPKIIVAHFETDFKPMQKKRFQANAFFLTLLGVSLVVSIGTKVYVTFVTLGKL